MPRIQTISVLPRSREFQPKETRIMNATRKLVSAALTALIFGSSAMAIAQSAAPAPMVAADGVIKVKSAYPMDETIARIKEDIAKKGIMFFSAVDQQQLAANAGI